MDGAPRFLTEAGVGFSVVEVEVTTLEVFELIESEAQGPRDVCPPDGGGVVVCWGEGHGIVVK